MHDDAGRTSRFEVCAVSKACETATTGQDKHAPAGGLASLQKLWVNGGVGHPVSRAA